MVNRLECLKIGEFMENIWYRSLPDTVYAKGHTGVDDIFKMKMLSQGRCVAKSTFKGYISNELYLELEDLIVNKFGFAPMDNYYRVPRKQATASKVDYDSWDDISSTFVPDEEYDKARIQVFCSTFVSPNGLIQYAHGSDSLVSVLRVFVGEPEFPTGLLESLRQLFGGVVKKKRPIKMFTLSMGELDITEVGEVGLPIIRNNYPDKVLEGYDRVVNTILDKNNTHGSIVVLEGEPGTGKSYLIRGLMEDIDATFIFVPVNIVETLTGPGAVPVLRSQYVEEGGKPLVLIIEDGDETILSREQKTNSLISTILNMGDGILGQILHTKMIISTNIPKASIDSAVLRPGRLNAYIEMTKLDNKRASEVYERLTGSKIEFKEKNLSLADVYARANDSQTMFKKEKKDVESGRYA